MKINPSSLYTNLEFKASLLVLPTNRRKASTYQKTILQSLEMARQHFNKPNVPGFSLVAQVFPSWLTSRTKFSISRSLTFCLLSSLSLSLSQKNAFSLNICLSMIGSVLTNRQQTTNKTSPT